MVRMTAISSSGSLTGSLLLSNFLDLFADPAILFSYSYLHGTLNRASSASEFSRCRFGTAENCR
jgi:hypothetical protein